MATKPVILTIDDDPEVLHAIERDLRQKYGSLFRVLRADSGATALETLAKVKLRNEPVALFLVDQRMPHMTGVEFLARAGEGWTGYHAIGRDRGAGRGRGLESCVDLARGDAGSGWTVGRGRAKHETYLRACHSHQGVHLHGSGSTAGSGYTRGA